MWSPEGKLIAKDSLGALTLIEVLFEFEEPLTFVCLDREGQPLLVHSLCAEAHLSRHLVSISDQRIIADLKAGRLDVLGALRQPRCWIVDFGPGWELSALWLIPFDQVPKNVLPKPGAMLTPDLDPLFRLRLIGSGVGPGKTSAADVRMAAQAAESSLKRLTEITQKQRKAHGAAREPGASVLGSAGASTAGGQFRDRLQRPPSEPRLFSQDAEIFEEMGKLLNKGLRMIQSDSEAEVAEGLDRDEVAQLLEAVKSLTPPTQGDVDRIEIGGRLVDQFDGQVILTREDRRRRAPEDKAASQGLTRRKTIPCDRSNTPGRQGRPDLHSA